MPFSRAFAGPLLGLVLAGCAETVPVWFEAGEFDNLATSSFRYAGAERDFRVCIVGNPFPVSAAETARAVIAAMQGEDKGLHTRFTTAPSAGAAYPFNITIVFDPVPGGAASLCRAPRSRAPLPRRQRITVVAAFCYGDELMYAMGSAIRPVASPRDPAFRRMIDRLMYYFVPYEGIVDEEPEEDDDDDN